MTIGMSVTTQPNALFIHGITAPLQTALIFVFFVIFMDFSLVSLLILRSFDMFRSILGTWIPFLLIFLPPSTVGLYLRRGTLG